jgi:UDP-glucose 4-epimerase
MKIAITGGNGRLGSEATTFARTRGHQVTVIDRAGPSGPESVVTDLTDFDSVSAFIGQGQFDAVIHLAGMPGRTRVAGDVLFRNNMLTSYNVLTAARQAAVRKIVFASSETILGLPFDISPAELPIVETSPTSYRVGHDYGTVKYLEDRIAQQMAADDPGLSISAIMLTTIVLPEMYADFARFEDAPRDRGYNLWSYTDVRDAAQGVVLASEHAEPGYERFILAADDTVMATSTNELVDRFHPTSRLTRELGPHESLFSNEKAKRVLGYSPRYGWRAGR